MILTLQIATIFFVAITMSLPLAHALEFPGKMRLNAETYMAVQTIYYPGFTIGGIGEPLAILGSLALLIAMWRDPAFWWIVAALLALIITHAVFWFVTQPTNRFWLRSQQMVKVGTKFFGTEEKDRQTSREELDTNWMRMRNQWEYSHIIRALLSAVALIVLLIALARSRL